MVCERDTVFYGRCVEGAAFLFKMLSKRVGVVGVFRDFSPEFSQLRHSCFTKVFKYLIFWQNIILLHLLLVMLFWLNARYFTLAVPLFTEDLVGQSVSQSVTCTAKNIPRVRTVADPDLKQTRRVGSGFVLLALPGFSPFCDFFFYPSPRSASVGEGKTVVKELVTDRTAFRGVVTSNCFFFFVCLFLFCYYYFSP